MMQTLLYLKPQLLVLKYTVVRMQEQHGKKHIPSQLIYIVPMVIILVKYL